MQVHHAVESLIYLSDVPTLTVRLQASNRSMGVGCHPSFIFPRIKLQIVIPPARRFHLLLNKVLNLTGLNHYLVSDYRIFLQICHYLVIFHYYTILLTNLNRRNLNAQIDNNH